ncbi:reverse transcriptase family protein [Cognatishimia sp. 1_MG-2023]|uniref:reverse transcriptase family protein n=1 Tax=Cognatishimia sp. 1_MG-2023 TaxID=3062642 RepID=UPI0026E42FF2|nr:reverse transcriptase family protein [Cognatishimia sp. 1_MG-2023]MDO6726841.1 reverse transcriptase family protein [Cognatishimia sp. 1_MG-2023]
MNSKELAQNLAQGLALIGWSKPEITAELCRRLPLKVQRLNEAISLRLLHNLPSAYAPTVNSIAEALRYVPNFEKVMRYCRRHDVWPNVDLPKTRMLPIAPFVGLDIPQLTTEAELADWLLIPVEKLAYFADIHSRSEEHGETSINHYHYVHLPKKHTGTRLVEAPKQRLKGIQRQIHRQIIAKVSDHDDAFGFIRGKNCLQGAARHASEEVVICFDLKDFFPSIGMGRIFGFFRCLGYPPEIARHLTAFCTTRTPPRILERMSFEQRSLYRLSHLPQGAPTSPTLANKVTFTLDRRLASLAQSLDANYSRYADDLSFSGDQKIQKTLLRAVPQIIREEGFQLNGVKTRVMKNTARQTVTGVVVNSHLNTSRSSFDHLKAVIHACGRDGDTRLRDPAFQSSLLGQIEWVESVNPRRGQKLRRLLAAASG